MPHSNQTKVRIQHCQTLVFKNCPWGESEAASYLGFEPQSLTNSEKALGFSEKKNSTGGSSSSQNLKTVWGPSETP